jgi:uncharacterized repeat protein (TIGR01451 family)
MTVKAGGARLGLLVLSLLPGAEQPSVALDSPCPSCDRRDVAPAPLAPPAFPLHVDAATRRLVDAAGAPFLVTGDAAWSLMVRLTQAEVQQYLDDRRARGFNTVLVNLIEHHFGGPVNRYGKGPFLTPGDFSTPDDAYFAHADWVISQAAQRGILVLLAPMYLGYQGGNEGWYQEMLANGTNKCRQYGRYVGERYAGFPNVIWVNGGDAPPMNGLAQIEAIVAGIKEFDTVHLHTAHSSRGRSAIDDYDRPWLDLNTTYTDCAGALPQSRADYLRTKPLPFFHIEGIYENLGASSSCLMGQAYFPAFLGARGHVFGNDPVWLFDPGWPNALGSAGATYMRNAWALLLSREGWGLVPDIDEQIVTSGRGSGTGYAAAARAPSGTSVLVYVPTARTLTVDTAQVPGASFVGWWFNAASGAAQMIGTFANGGSRAFTTPAGGPWVLVLDDAAASLPPPGASLLPDLTLGMVGPLGYTPGSSLDYTLTITNAGTASAAGVQLTSATPPGLAFVSNAGACTTPFPCSLGALAPGAVRTVVSTLAVPSPYGGPDPIVNAAQVSSSTPDADLTDNQASISTRQSIPAMYYTVTPCRAVDTRSADGPALGAGDLRVIALTGRCGIPSAARAVSVNVTVTSAFSAGHLTVFPTGTAERTTSTLNYGAGQTRANNALISLSGDGKITIRCAQAAGTVHTIIDVNGWLQ